MTSKTELLKVLKESLFDPRQKNPLSVLVEMDSPDYCERKAQELIMESYQEKNYDRHDSKIRQAITLLALARVLRKPAKIRVRKSKIESVITESVKTEVNNGPKENQEEEGARS